MQPAFWGARSATLPWLHRLAESESLDTARIPLQIQPAPPCPKEGGREIRAQLIKQPEAHACRSVEITAPVKHAHTHRATLASSAVTAGLGVNRFSALLRIYSLIH